MRTVRAFPLDTSPASTQNQKETGGMRTPHRRDISARQDLIGRELRDLFDGYTSEQVPDDLMRLAEQLQSAFEQRDAAPPAEPAPAKPLRGEPEAD
ncbi:hypothetical protein [Xanthobacter tagetidis]|uniref:Anti-sigma factor NepR domain-containing protein n=1 Tax=Xanthobacter tagetidis TaxID=60216 RepID=A0A3L7AIQ4_9HYPH|nr:hypothetical protein [Xanthobacter tagetidis]MBB6306819.1 hypothetical protein [Xanthobacter tagetidis]RLP80107.1 hypothetical protein D9R14_07065 [Xanthobacter tagetidis]